MTRQIAVPIGGLSDAALALLTGGLWAAFETSRAAARADLVWGFGELLEQLEIEARRRAEGNAGARELRLSVKPRSGRAAILAEGLCIVAVAQRKSAAARVVELARLGAPNAGEEGAGLCLAIAAALRKRT